MASIARHTLKVCGRTCERTCVWVCACIGVCVGFGVCIVCLHVCVCVCLCVCACACVCVWSRWSMSESTRKTNEKRAYSGPWASMRACVRGRSCAYMSNCVCASLLLHLCACDIVSCLHVCSRSCLRLHARFESERVCVHNCVLEKLTSRSFLLGMKGCLRFYIYIYICIYIYVYIYIHTYKR